LSAPDLSLPARPASGPALPQPVAVLQLLKPITWFAPMWAFGCGIASSGQPILPRLGLIAAGVLLCGPLVTGTSQAVNDWFDRHVDAINEPNRPIPSGRVPGAWGLIIACVWTLVSMAVAASLGLWVFLPACLGMALAWAYSAPPLRLKLNGWWGPGAVGLCYETLPWFTAAAVMAGAFPDWHIVVIALCYGVGAHGIMTLNDFKAVEGDRQMGVNSLPVTMGVEHAARLACIIMAGPQAIVVTLLAVWGHLWYALAVGVLLGTQFDFMARLMRAPKEKAPWYNATGTTLYVLGMLVAAFAVRP
jgi:chlorophyll synthase